MILYEFEEEVKSRVNNLHCLNKNILVEKDYAKAKYELNCIDERIGKISNGLGREGESENYEQKADLANAIRPLIKYMQYIYENADERGRCYVLTDKETDTIAKFLDFIEGLVARSGGQRAS